MKRGHTSSIRAIQEEYQRIDNKWMKLQFRALLYLMILAAAAEAAMFFILRWADMIGISLEQYALRYIAAPTLADFLLLLIAWLTLRNKKISLWRKAYLLSLVMSLCCFVLYTVHIIFHALYLIFAIPMVLTVVYGDQKLTGITALTSVGGKVISDLFLVWDPDKPPIFSDKLSAVDFFLSFLFLGILYYICRLMIRIEREKNYVSIGLERERQRFKREAMTDPLTKLWNRKALREEFQRIEETPGQSCMLAMLDMDDFKALNDTYGHSRGDAYLRELGAVLKRASGENTATFRFGGDEFCIMYHGATKETVLESCRNIQEDFSCTEINRNGESPVTLSIGVAVFRIGEKPSQLLERSDAALYRAKKEKGGICYYE